ncbi:MAG: hypothetical protein ACKV2U_06190 [Bryobacteraceae bacterium]
MAATLMAGNAEKPILLIYKIAQPPMWILYVLMVVEVFQKIFDKFPGIARFAKRVVLISMVMAFLFALASIGGDLTVGWNGQSMISRYSVILRTISSALSLYMILIAAFLLWMPVPLPPNTIRHSFLFFFYFFVTTGVHYVLNTNRGEYVQLANLVISVLTLVALLSWYFLLQAEGEAVPAGGKVPRTASADMLGRLEALNRTLSGPRE